MSTTTRRRANKQRQQAVEKNRDRTPQSAGESYNFKGRGKGGSAKSGASPENAGYSTAGFRPEDPAFRELFGSFNASGSRFINEATALNFSAIYSAVTLIANAMSNMTVDIIKQDPSNPRGTIKVKDHPAHRLFNFSPDGETPSLLAREAAQAHTLLTGNSYFEVVRNGRGQATELHLLHPSRVTCGRHVDDGKKFYKVTSIHGVDDYRNDEILHVPALTWDGVCGLSPIKLARDTIALALSLQEYGNKFFDKGGRPLGFLTKPTIIPEPQRKQYRHEWKEMHEGKDNWFAVGILSGGLEWKNIGVTPDEAQFLTTRQFQIEEIARWYHIPPHMLAMMQKAGQSNSEQMFLEFAVFTLLPWVRRWEAEMNMKLFTRVEQNIYSVQFNMEGLLRGDPKTRAEICERMFKCGVLTMNEWRELDKRNAFTDCGDKPFILASQLATAEQVEKGLNLNSPLKKQKAATDPTPDPKTTDLVFAELNDSNDGDE